MSANTKVALILAAGNGSRLSPVAGSMPKPLVELQGRPLIEHVVLGARDAGIERFVVVAGFRADAIRSWAAGRCQDGMHIDVIENPDYKLKANGISVLKARDLMTEPFLLLMADHIFETETAAAFLRQPVEPGTAVLAVDSKLASIFDIEDATKVLRKGKHILEIGKGLSRYDAADTGMFLCTPAVFSALADATVDGNCSLSDGMRLLAQRRKLQAFDIGDGMWQDVDTPEALAHAELVFGDEYGTDAKPMEISCV